MTSSNAVWSRSRAAPRRGRFGARAKVAWFAVLVALLAGFAHRYAERETARTSAVFEGTTMGTTYVVKLSVAPMPEPEHRRVAEAIERRLERVEALMSTYRPDSEISRFNRWRNDQPFEVSRETLEVVRLAQQVSASTEGAFDITVAPLVAAWGFGVHASDNGRPTRNELHSLQERVGYRLLDLGSGDRTLRKQHPELTLDLSAIAKGYGVDEVAEELESRGYSDYLVEVGGEVRTRGKNSLGLPWSVGIERPSKSDRVVGTAVQLGNRALATSGNYRNFHERFGRTVSHTIDPRTGRPVDHSVASVSVIHARAVMADALATAFHVLGDEEGYELALREGLAVRFVSGDGSGGCAERVTPAFQALVRPGAR